jgi:hypothetical protein
MPAGCRSGVTSGTGPGPLIDTARNSQFSRGAPPPPLPPPPSPPMRYEIIRCLGYSDAEHAWPWNFHLARPSLFSSFDHITIPRFRRGMPFACPSFRPPLAKLDTRAAEAADIACSGYSHCHRSCLRKYAFYHLFRLHINFLSRSIMSRG